MSSDEESIPSEDEDCLEVVEELQNIAQPVEQVVQFEGTNDDEQPNSNQTEEENKKETKVKRVRRPQPKLDAERLRGPRGIRMLNKIFENVKFKGRGYEEENLSVLMKNYEYWCHRMFPKYPFDDCLEKMEKLGHKRYLQTYIKKLRLNLVDDEDEITTQQDRLNDEIIDRDSDEEDTFESLLSTPVVQSNDPDTVALSEEQLKRIEINREKAQRLRLQALIKNNSSNENVTSLSTNCSNEVDEQSAILSQDSNVNFSDNMSQFTIEAEIHTTNNIIASKVVEEPLNKSDNNEESMDVTLNTVEVNEPNILSQNSGDCNVEESINSAYNCSQLTVNQAEDNTHQNETATKIDAIITNTSDANKVFKDAAENVDEIDVSNVVSQKKLDTLESMDVSSSENYVSQSEVDITVSSIIENAENSPKGNNEINAFLNKEGNQQEELFESTPVEASNQKVLEQKDDNELSDDVLADFMNEDFDDLIQKNFNQKNLVTDSAVSQKEDINKSQNSLVMEIDS